MNKISNLLQSIEIKKPIPPSKLPSILASAFNFSEKKTFKFTNERRQIFFLQINNKIIVDCHKGTEHGEKVLKELLSSKLLKVKQENLEEVPAFNSMHCNYRDFIAMLPKKTIIQKERKEFNPLQKKDFISEHMKSGNILLFDFQGNLLHGQTSLYDFRFINVFLSFFHYFPDAHFTDIYNNEKEKKCKIIVIDSEKLLYINTTTISPQDEEMICKTINSQNWVNLSSNN